MADPAAAQGAAEPATSGLPQFDLSQWPGQMVWMLVTFGVMLAIFYWFVAPRIGGAIAAREDKIGGDIGEARRLRDEAQAQSDAAADELVQARARAQKLAADAKATAQAEAAKRQGEEEARLGQVIGEAEARIAAARAEAMAEVRAIAADAAQAMVEKLTGAAANAAEVERALA
jgi:F-type H+-transporting ATPase subunit b